MSSKINGFVWLETMLILSGLLLLALTIIPIYTTLKQEKRIVHERAIIVMQLHDELQKRIYEQAKKPQGKFTIMVEQREVTFRFFEEGDLIKGCAFWQNVKQREEELCLYGMVEE